VLLGTVRTLKNLSISMERRDRVRRKSSGSTSKGGFLACLWGIKKTAKALAYER
jgi:hypothetical protein